MKNLVLIGMPACGKTSVGVLLAKALGMDFIDTDRELEHADGRRLSAIARQERLEGFRASSTPTEVLPQAGMPMSIRFFTLAYPPCLFPAKNRETSR